ncbi:MAG: adenylate/guanylate cyclase domain-containing protein [Chlamydiales bacterium]|nr:adenylate/guanylate cyclase domain-containing protein [Chlamydiales bacterium]
MPIRIKLFIYIGSLFLLVALASYFLPKVFVQGDVRRVHSLFSDEIAIQNKNGREMWQRLFNERLNQSIIAINTTLAHVSTENESRKALTLAFEKDAKAFWMLVKNLINDNPGVDFLQVSKNNVKSLSVVLSNAKFYSVQAELFSNNIGLMLLTAETDQKNVLGPFIGIRFPMTSELANVPPLINSSGKGLDVQQLRNAAYYLYPMDVLNLPKDVALQVSSAISLVRKGIMIAKVGERELLKTIEKHALQLESQLIGAKIASPDEFQVWQEHHKSIVEAQVLAGPSAEEETPVILKPPKVVESSKRTNIVREYVTVYLDAIKGSPFDKGTPIGGATLYGTTNTKSKRDFSGGALLNHDIFFQDPLFNPESYFQDHLPLPEHTFLATGIGLIDSPLLSKYLIANVVPISNASFNGKKVELEKDPVFLTVGQSLFGDIRSTLLVPDSQIVFLNEDGTFLHAINDSKDEIPSSFFHGFSFPSIVNTTLGQMNIGDIPYSYFQLEPSVSMPIKAFVLIPSASEPMFRLQEVVNSNMISIYQALSSQLFATSLILLGVALFLLGYLSKRITKPITILARATEKVVKGNYSSIQLPKVEDAHDEISVLTNSFANMVQGLQDKEKIRDLLDKVVSKEIAAEILKGKVQLGGESRIVSVLFVDIRGFTRLTEQVDPQIVISQLNKYMTEMSNIIEHEGGVIDKYIGDEIMALYGAPVAMEDSAKRALTTALKMLESLNYWNAKRIKEGLVPIQVGIGIHTGKVVAGNMGADKRLNYTVLGANVNFAARLCSVAGPMEIRVSEATLTESGMKDHLKVKPLPPEIFKGFSTEQISYSIMGYKSIC